MIKFKFKQFKKKSGTLVPFSLQKQIPFQSKRIFIIYGNKNYVRGKKLKDLINWVKLRSNSKKMTLSGCIFEKTSNTLIISREK